MDYYIYKDDQNVGPLPESEVRAGLRSGRFLRKDLGCRVGETEWKDLSFLFPLETSPPVYSPSPMPVQQPVRMSPQNVVQQPVVVYEPPQRSQSNISDVGKIMLFESNKKSVTAAILLCIFLGGLGIHRFYLGRNGSGGAMLAIWATSLILMFVLIGFLTIWITPIWAFIDLFLISGMVKKYNDDLALRMGIYN